MPCLKGRGAGPQTIPPGRPAVQVSDFFAQDPQVGTPGSGGLCRGFEGVLAGALGGLGGWFFGGLPHCIHERGQIIAAGDPRLSGEIQPDYFPSQRHREPGSVGVAQIVTMGFGVGCQRSQHRGGIGVHIRQGGNSCLSAR